MSMMNERTGTDWQETEVRQDEAGTVRRDAESGMTMQESQAGGELTTADIARGGAKESPTAPTESQAAQEQTPLFASDEAEQFRSRWSGLQTSFVDNPRQTVEQADALVAEVMKRLAEVFANERSELERQWERGEDVSTEDLRIALQRYRSFFTRLLSL